MAHSTARSRLAPWRPLIAAALAVTVMGGCSQAEPETSEGQPILTFVKEIRQAEYPTTVLWGPDNRHILVAGYADATVRIIDTETYDPGRVIATRVGDRFPALAWSPDGKAVAISELSTRSRIRVVSAEDGRQIAELPYPRETPPEGCRFGGRPLSFTADSRSLWTACEGESVRGEITQRFLIAMKLDASSLAVQDKQFLPSPVPDRIMRLSEPSVFVRDGGMRMCAVINSSITQPGDLLSTWRRFAYCYDLDSKQELFPHFELAGDGGAGYFRYPQQLVLFPDSLSLLVRLDTSVSDRPGIPHVPSLDRQFDLYDVRDGRRQAAYGGDQRHAYDPKRHGNTEAPEDGAIGSVALLAERRLMVGYWSRASMGSGGLVVFDPRDGSNLQRIHFGRTRSLAVSPDGRHVAAMINGSNLRIYRVN